MHDDKNVGNNPAIKRKLTIPVYLRMFVQTVQTNTEAARKTVTKVLAGQTKLTRDVT
jgi:hypothetical protein